MAIQSRGTELSAATNVTSNHVTFFRCAAGSNSPKSISRALALLRVGTLSRVWRTAFLFLALSILANPTRADECVRFDTPDVVAWDEVHDSTFEELNPSEKLITLTFPVSAFVHHRFKNDLFQITYIAEFPERLVRVVEYSPHTELQSEVSGTINVSRQNEYSAGAGISATAKLDSWISANGNMSRGQKNSESEQFQRNPTKDWIAASGTLSRGAAVYFKLRPSTQTTLEGSQEFSLVLKVPKKMRADYFRLSCAAYSTEKGFNGSTPLCGTTTFMVGAYQGGDPSARSDVQRLLESEMILRSVAKSYQHQIFPKSRSDLKSVFDSIVGKKQKSQIPANWLKQIENQRAASRTIGFEKHLPEPVREAISTYRLAKVHMFRNAI